MTSLTYVSAEGCTCAKEAPRTAIKEAGAVFSAKVVSYQQGFRSDYSINNKFPYIHSSQTWEINTTFSVSKVWKGAIQETITLKSRVNQCGGQFTVGGEYLVYAYWKEGSLTTLPCTRTSLLPNAGDDFKVLGEGQPPERIPNLTDKLRAVGGLAIALMLVSGVVWFGSRIVRKKKTGPLG
ncbi:MAG: hypothetical protein AB7U82_17530 [Blastocatellales bacterium]